MKNVYRLIFAPWYLIGWAFHIYNGIWSPEVYQGFSKTVIFPPVQWIWFNAIIPNITLFTLLLAVIQIVIGVLFISKGKWVKIGVCFSLAFNVGQVFLGLAWPAETAWLDFAQNRLPNMIFAVAQIPLFWVNYDRSIAEDIRNVYHARQGRTGPVA